MLPTTYPGAAAARILEAMGDAWMIGVAGVPGAGKSTVAAVAASRVPGAVVVPMDGYHIPRSGLTSDQSARRGAPDTFDPEAFRADLVRLREKGSGLFPSFDHAAKDPAPRTIAVPPGTTLVIVEGLYLLLRSWRVADLFDLTVFLDCDLDTAMDRVAARHLACGLAESPEQARHRAETNDRRNALAILEDGCRDRAQVVIPACGGESPGHNPIL